MKKYAKVLNEETKLCAVGSGTNSAFYQSIGMPEVEVEQAWDGLWYLRGFAPEKSIEKMQEEARKVRNQLLEQTDKFLLADYPITDSEREQYKAYRSYLRDYPQTEEWYKQNPLRFDEWLSENK